MSVLSKIPRVAPGILVGFLNIVAPQAAYVTLFAKIPTDDRVKAFFSNAESSGIMDAHAQISIVFVTTTVLIITSSIQIFRATSQISKVFSWITLVISGLVFLYLFAFGGGVSIPLEPYMRISEPGKIHFPPTTSWLTWIRFILVIFGLILSLLELSGGAKDINNAGNS